METKDTIDLLEDLIKRRQLNTKESRAEALKYITNYLEKMKGSSD